jgi:hypothetical protein
MISNLRPTVISLSIACVLALALSVHASPTSWWRIDGNGYWTSSQYVDFASSTIHETYATTTFSPQQPNVKYHLLHFTNNPSFPTDPGYCFEVVTAPPSAWPPILDSGSSTRTTTPFKA